MGKFLKKLFGLAIFSGLAYLGYKLYSLIKATIDLDKVLPQYLENVYSEKPAISIQLSFSGVAVKAEFSKKMMNKKDELRKAIESYIKDFYPAVCPKYLSVVVAEKTTEKVVEKQESKPEKIVEKQESKPPESTLPLEG